MLTFCSFNRATPEVVCVIEDGLYNVKWIYIYKDTIIIYIIIANTMGPGKALDKERFSCSKILMLSANPMLLVSQKNRLNETILLSTYNKGLCWIIREMLWGK